MFDFTFSFLPYLVYPVLSFGLQALAQAIWNQNVSGGMGEFHGLNRFQRKNPSMFRGRYDPDGVQNWLKEIENIGL